MSVAWSVPKSKCSNAAPKGNGICNFTFTQIYSSKPKQEKHDRMTASFSDVDKGLYDHKCITRMQMVAPHCQRNTPPRVLLPPSFKPTDQKENSETRNNLLKVAWSVPKE